jgi:hypothetical protein
MLTESRLSEVTVDPRDSNHARRIKDSGCVRCAKPEVRRSEVSGIHKF